MDKRPSKKSTSRASAYSSGRFQRAHRRKRQHHRRYEIAPRSRRSTTPSTPAQVILASHLGRPRQTRRQVQPRPVAIRLNRLLNKDVKFAKDCIGPTLSISCKACGPAMCCCSRTSGSCRRRKERRGFRPCPRALTDVYVNDAFGTAHRAHASTYGIAKHVKFAVAGFLMKKEIEYLQKTVANPVRPSSQSSAEQRSPGRSG